MDWPPSPAHMLNQKSPARGIPYDSNFLKSALGMSSYGNGVSIWDTLSDAQQDAWKGHFRRGGESHSK
jgi:hypothetical protein